MKRMEELILVLFREWRREVLTCEESGELILVLFREWRREVVSYEESGGVNLGPV